MSFYVFETQYKHARTCDTCGIGMSEGYLHDIGDDAFCSPACATFKYGPIDFTNLLDMGELFWTSWYDEVEVVE